jgi:nicotinamidase-related amidase
VAQKRIRHLQAEPSQLRAAGASFRHTEFCGEGWLNAVDQQEPTLGNGDDDMGGYTRKPVNWQKALIDVSTQRDYLESKAILQVANREALIAHLKQIFTWVRQANIGVVSIIESHRPTEPINGTPLHCVDGTVGQRKTDYTLLRPRILVEADNSLSLPPDLGKKYRQLMFRKRSRDVLSNPKVDRLLTQLNAEEFILLGVGLERAIRGLALGLLLRHKRVTVIQDACGYWSAGDADLAARQLAAKGIQILDTTDFCARPTRPSRPRRITRRRTPPTSKQAPRPATHKSR